MMFAPSTMERTAERTAEERRGPGRLSAALLASLAIAGSAAAQSERPDQVTHAHPRTGRISTASGVVTQNALTGVRLEDESGQEQRFAVADVRRIVWGTAPPSFREGQTYRERGDLERALANFRTAASDASARPVVQAAARLEAAETLLERGALDPNEYTECVAECDRFLADHPENRAIPRVRWIKARATWLGGDPAAAAQLFLALYQEGANEPATEGYSRVACLEAGLEAAEAYLATSDTLAARELFAGLESAFASMIAALDVTADPAHRARLEGGQGRAATGEGFCLLAAGEIEQAASFFENRLAAAGAATEEGLAATLGLAEALLASGETRRAEVEFAKVSAIDHTSRDRTARALLGLARSSLQLMDQGSQAAARRWLTYLKEHLGDTPAARPAAELLATL